MPAPKKTTPSLERSNAIRNSALFLGIAAWIFLLLSLGSFHPTDWPSHEVFPYPAIQNACGSAGAWVAYHCFLGVGQGVFPILFFSGVCLALLVFKSRVSDIWLRVIGLMLLATAFAATVHHLRPGSANGLPEGHGGLLGIAVSSFLQAHFSIWGTRLVLITATFIGLLLAADDLVLQMPQYANVALAGVRERVPSLPQLPQFRFNFPELPKLPSLPRFITRDALRSSDNAPTPLKLKGEKSAKQTNAQDDDLDEPLKPPVIFKPSSTTDDIELTYENDEPTPAESDAAFIDTSDPGPAEAAVIPPPEEQKVPQPAAPEPVAAASEAVEVAPPEQRKEIIVKLPSMIKPRQTSPPPRPKELGEYHLPPWDVLGDAEHGYAESQEAFVREQAAILEQALKEFNIDAHVVEIDTGPVITMYEIALAPGVKVGTITSLSNDIMRALKAESVRIVAPVPGKNTVGIEVPNQQKEKVRIKELMQLAPEAMAKMAIPLFLGKDASGEPLITDLAAMPHCLIAGTTGSGKSVCINTIIMSVMYLQRPDMVKMILIDPKVVEMAPFKDIPHLMCPVINETGRATSVLDWACEKMDERYELLAEAGVRNIKGYNALTREELFERFQPGNEEEEAKIPKKLPYIVIIIDELADLMMTSGKEVETFIVRLAQKARAVGIHLIVATQRPQATVVTGLIKSNLPSKIAFRVNSRMDSRIVLDQNGAELLLGQGDMLFLPPGASKPIRSQGTYVDDKEIRESVKLLKSLADAQYEPELVQIKTTVGANGEIEKDELFDDAVRIVLETKRGSVSLLQRRLTIGYSRASRLIEQMAATGILGDYKGSQARECNITIDEWEAMKAQEQKDLDDGMTV
ncbi:MAG TPA: DNA translocase FtsK [Tepidisphaeraceae bacterium]|jgi:S-DNA-T family DNA segregation ATPase FtsK/SpoIIIE